MPTEAELFYLVLFAVLTLVIHVIHSTIFGTWRGQKSPR
jgi:hypothetical protein